MTPDQFFQIKLRAEYQTDQLRKLEKTFNQRCQEFSALDNFFSTRNEILLLKRTTRKAEAEQSRVVAIVFINHHHIGIELCHSCRNSFMAYFR